jgi:hypothetical protein
MLLLQRTYYQLNQMADRYPGLYRRQRAGNRRQPGVTAVWGSGKRRLGQPRREKSPRTDLKLDAARALLTAEAPPAGRAAAGVRHSAWYWRSVNGHRQLFRQHQAAGAFQRRRVDVGDAAYGVIVQDQSAST